MRKILIAVSAPLLLSLVLVAAKYLFWGEISLFWALSPLWVTLCAAIVVFWAVWLVIAWQRWRLEHGRKICRNCIHCSLADLRPGRKLCLQSLKEVSPTDRACEEFDRVIPR